MVKLRDRLVDHGALSHLKNIACSQAIQMMQEVIMNVFKAECVCFWGHGSRLPYLGTIVPLLILCPLFKEDNALNPHFHII